MFIETIPTLLTSRVWEWPEPLRWSAVAVVLILAFLAINTFFGYRLRHFAIPAHLPAPVGGLVGSGVFAAIYMGNLYDAFATLAIACVTYFISLIRLNRARAADQLERAFDEDPISTASEDRFGHLSIAQRLAKRLSTGCGPIVIIGRYGSGKTSVGNLVYEMLSQDSRRQKRHHEWLKISVSGWGISDPEARAKEILGAICDHIQEDVDTIALREQCRGFIRGVFGEVHWLARLAFSAQDRSARIITDQLDKLLALSDKSVLVILDDFERSARSDDGRYRWDAGVAEVVDGDPCLATRSPRAESTVFHQSVARGS